MLRNQEKRLEGRNHMIDVTDVSKSYGTVQALDGVSFRVEDGEVIGLLGPNGAGKTTMIKILTGYLQADEGQVTVDGLDVLTHTLDVQRRIGYLPENAPLYPEMSVQGYLMMMADLRQIPDEDRLSCLTEAVRATGLEDQLTRPIGELSKGYRQRVGLAQAILHRPKLLILDEPTVGLDPTQIVEVRRLIGRLARHSTVLLSTHILSEVEATCGRVIILLNGEVKADASLTDLAATGHVVLVLGGSTAPAVGDVTSALKALPQVRSVESVPVADGREYRVQPTAAAGGKPAVDLRPLLYNLARERDWPLRELRREVRTLETVFGELTRSQSGMAAGGQGVAR
jgi:ABC-2 type transport system ATP-binding protein